MRGSAVLLRSLGSGGSPKILSQSHAVTVCLGSLLLLQRFQRYGRSITSPCPGIQSKLGGEVYSEGLDEEEDNTEQRIPIGIKGKNLL